VVYFLNKCKPIKVTNPFKIKRAKPKSKLKKIKHARLMKKVKNGDAIQIAGTKLSFTLVLVNKPKAYKPNNGPYV
jgi:hypothetical protein